MFDKVKWSTTKETILVKRYSFFSTALVLMACAVLFSASAFAQRTNRGKHMTGGHGSSHKGGHYSSTSQGNKHLVGGSGHRTKAGIMSAVLQPRRAAASI
jgi:hypothetical protein